MMVPTIHLNGTSRDELITQILDAKHALATAMRLLALASPNGRDYYPQGPDAIQQAGAEHHARIAKVEEVYDELNTLALAIDDAGR